MREDLRLSEEFSAYLHRRAGKMGPLGPSLHRRSYARDIYTPEGEKRKETWRETVQRVAKGNMNFVQESFRDDEERKNLQLLLDALILVPAGRHLRQTGAPKGVQFINNCHVVGFDKERPTHHFEFLFNGLMQGGGVGSNYSSKHTDNLPTKKREVDLFLYIDETHPDEEEVSRMYEETAFDSEKPSSHLLDNYEGPWDTYLRVKDSREGWAEALTVLLNAYWDERDSGHHRMIMFNFSDIRGRGEPIKRFGGTASGPSYLVKMLIQVQKILVDVEIGSRLTGLDCMEIDHEIAQCVISGNVRRSARMSIMHWRDPLIFSFLRCKNDLSKHWSTNISVEVDDEFNEAINDGYHKHRELAWDVFEEACQRGLEHGEPGFWNSSLSNVGENRIAIATNPCVPGDTWITTTEGPRQVRSLVGRKFSVPTDHGPYDSTAQGFWSTGVKPVYRVRTDRGFELTCTGNHRLKTPSGAFVEASSLEEGDLLLLENRRGFEEWGSSEEEDLGWLLGSYWGDGSSGIHPRLAFWGEDREERLDSAIRILRENGLLSKESSEGQRPEDKGRPWEKSSEKFTEFLMSMGCLEKNAEEAHPLESSSSSMVRGFLQGIFGTDGSVQGSSDKGISLRLSQSDEPLLKMVQRMLLRFGIVSKIFLNRRTEQHRNLPDGRGGEKEYLCKPQHELVISRKSLEIFHQVVGLRRGYKHHKLLSLLGEKKRPSYRDKFEDRVISVELIGEMEVFDCTIQDIHVYGSNGFLSHNCGEEVMEANEACNIGHLNLYDLFLYDGEDRDEMVHVCWRYLARYLVRASEGDTVDEAQREVVNRNRRIGAGFFGFLGMLTVLRIPYATCYANEKLGEYLRSWFQTVRSEASLYADEIGFARPIKVTTLAPTGTVSKMTNAPPSAQALIAREFILRVRFAADDPQVAEALEKGLEVEDCIYSPNTKVVLHYMRDPLIEHLYEEGWSKEDVEYYVKTQDELDLEDSLRVQLFLQQNWADNAISFTHMLYPGKNLPSLSDYMTHMRRALPYLKGTTVMKDAGRPQSPFTKITAEEYERVKQRHEIGQAEQECLNGACSL